MAQKYLMALEYADVHANSVLQKHAKKRPLGDLELKHRYTPTQPVLSCRTVNIDVSGTRTYRPRSSADIISEQHALIHKIYTKSRNVTSAPPRRPKTPQSPTGSSVKSNNYENNKLKSVEVQGRPLTSLSQRPPTSATSRSSTSSKPRPKTAGAVKARSRPSSESFMVVKGDRDLLETRRSYRSLTDKIHKHWQPESHDLNTGTYQRGKKPPGTPSVDAWLTFAGPNTGEANGVVDAFADVDKQGEYYNIEGGVGSRIAQQLQKGDKVRIGINGNVQSDDLKVKKWVKEDSFIKADDESSKENMAKNDNIIPLSWDDQVTSEQAKVITPRGPPADKKTINLCETRPVVFRKLIPDDAASQNGSASAKKKEGFRVKQRKKSKPGVDGIERANKVTVVTIDAKSHDEEKKVDELTVDDVVRKSCQSRNPEKVNSRHEDGEKLSVTFSFAESDAPGLHEALNSHSKVSIAESVSSGSSEQNKHVKVKPSQPTFSSKYQEVDLDIIGTLSVANGTRPLSNENEAQSFFSNTKFPPKSPQVRLNSARSSRSSLKSGRSSQQKSLGSNSIISISSHGSRQNEAEYIKISQPVVNPNSQQKHPVEYASPGVVHEMMRAQMPVSGVREPVPSPELEHYEENDEEESIPPLSPPIQVKTVIKPTTPALSINIPTADYTDSALNSPSHKNAPDIEASPQTKRAQDSRDEQIDQITSLLGDAIIGPENQEEEQS